MKFEVVRDDKVYHVNVDGEHLPALCGFSVRECFGRIRTAFPEIQETERMDKVTIEVEYQGG